MSVNEFSKYIDDINRLNPDIVVITGDFIDDDTSYNDMIDGTNALGNIKTNYGVYFIYGNHDKGYYNHRNYNNDQFVSELKKNNVIVLEDEIKKINNKIILLGRRDKEDKNRLNILSLKEKIDKDNYFIVLNHQPNDYDNEKKAMVDLVLSGHTHGGQLFPLGPLGIILGANDKTYGIEKRDNTTFIVSSGISDWKIKFKLGAISEYVVIDIKRGK